MEDPPLEDFEEPKLEFKRPSRPKIVRSRKKQADIRRVLGINPELDFKEEERLRKMILQKSREENLNADDFQIALALSESIRVDQQQKQTKAKGNGSRSNQRAIDFFDKLGMNQKKKRGKKEKATLLTSRDAAKEYEKIQAKIEEIVNRICSQNSSSPSTFGSVGKFPLGSCYLYDMRVPDSYLRIIPMNINGRCCEETMDKYYVTSDLFPDSKVLAGYLLRDWAKVPGRTPSPESGRTRLSIERPGVEDAIEMELERELESVNKQSEAFLQNFEWRDNASPDLFGDLSTSAGSLLAVEEEESQVVNESGDEQGTFLVTEEKRRRKRTVL